MKKEQDLEEDYEEARKVYQDLLEKGQEALELTMRIAVSTEHPRSIEALATLLTTLANTNDKSMELHRKYKEITAPTKNESRPGIEDTKNDTVFLGSSSELLAVLANKIKLEREGEVIDVTPEES